jgi:hypothetical protein
MDGDEADKRFFKFFVANAPEKVPTQTILK